MGVLGEGKEAAYCLFPPAEDGLDALQHIWLSLPSDDEGHAEDGHFLEVSAAFRTILALFGWLTQAIWIHSGGSELAATVNESCWE